ncbi:hypothetical protein N7523_005729 [Penicillium sp. IBT 18751x]|nr:hypothetical protein N7523_005677 [Penicillium sp. IBT 18751x]KAJ6117978.1 hypothetical protein N7523_005729 [Penicillium sp. IBT 18751x]
MVAHADTRVVIIAGATSGIGASLAHFLCRGNWKVACVGRREEAGEALLKSIPANEDKLRFFRADVSNYKEYAKVFDDVHKAWGRIDALCHNAGIVDTSSIYNYNWKKEDKGVGEIPPAPDVSVVDTNLTGFLYGLQLAIHFMRFNPPPGGHIVVTSSIAAIFPHATYPMYCATKAAVNQMVRAVAGLLKQKDNIMINALLPGIVSTPIVPRGMIEAVSSEHLTSMQTVLEGIQIFLEDTTGQTGQILECSVDKHIYYKLPDYGNGNATKRATTVYDPLFKIYHGEASQLPDAIP